MEYIEAFIEKHEIIITVLIAVAGVVVAAFAWYAARKSTKVAIRIAQEQEGLSMQIQQQSVKVSLLDHRQKVYDQLAEWIGYADVITNRNIPFSESLERFYCMVLRKTNFVPVAVKPDYNDLQIDTILVRLQTERNTIQLFKILYKNFDENDYSLVCKFVEIFMDTVLHIDEEMGQPRSAFHYVNALEKANIAVREADILERMRKEMKPL